MKLFRDLPRGEHATNGVALTIGNFDGVHLGHQALLATTIQAAKERLDAAFKRLLQLKMYPADKIWLGSGAHRTLSALADYEAENGNIPRAAEIYRELLDKTASSKPGPETSLEDALDQSSIYTGMAAVHRRAGQAERGSALEARRLELWRRWERKLPNNPFVLRQIAAKPAR